MQTREPGRSGLVVSSIGYGCMSYAPLVADERSRIEDAMRGITVRGHRDPEHLRSRIGR